MIQEIETLENMEGGDVLVATLLKSELEKCIYCTVIKAIRAEKENPRPDDDVATVAEIATFLKISQGSVYRLQNSAQTKNCLPKSPKWREVEQYRVQRSRKPNDINYQG